MKYLILLIGLLIVSSQAGAASNDIERDWDKRVMRKFDDFYKQQRIEKVATARAAAEEATGAKVISLKYNPYASEFVSGTGTIEEKIWTRMSNGQVCLVPVYNGKVYKPSCN